MALSARTVYAGNTGSTLGVLVDPGSTGDMQLIKLAVGSLGTIGGGGAGAAAERGGAGARSMPRVLPR